MPTITGLTAARMLEIEDASIVDGEVVGDNLILEKHDGTPIDAGNVRGPTGATGTGVSLSGLYSARPTAISGLNGQQYFATDKMMTWQCISAVWVLVSVFAPEVVALPSSPIDQQECIYVADTTLGVKWHLRYRSASASAYKWEVIGGTPMIAETATAETTASTSYVDLTTVGPSITIPLAGDYAISFTVLVANNTINAVSEATVKLGAAAAATAERSYHISATANAASAIARFFRRSALAAAAVIKLQYSVSAGTGTFTYRQLQVMPTRVG